MILLDNVSKYYPGDKLPALDNVSLHIQPKEFVFLVGKSGADKSTLIKMLTREEKPTSGKIMVGGIDYEYMKRRHIPHLRLPDRCPRPYRPVQGRQGSSPTLCEEARRPRGRR